MRVFLEF